VYVSVPAAAGHVTRRPRPASTQPVDHYDQIPADLAPPPSAPAARHASADDLPRAARPQPPLPRSAPRPAHRHRHGDGDGEGSRGWSEVTVDAMTRKPSYDDNDVILIDSAIYG